VTSILASMRPNCMTSFPFRTIFILPKRLPSHVFDWNCVSALLSWKLLGYLRSVSTFSSVSSCNARLSLCHGYASKEALSTRDSFHFEPQLLSSTHVAEKYVSSDCFSCRDVQLQATIARKSFCQASASHNSVVHAVTLRLF
jgi:hypothetical protein